MSDDWLLDGATLDTQTITGDWTPHDMRLIDGVRVKEVKHMPKMTGALTEVYRADWGLDTEPISQVFQVQLLPGAVSAWHAHAQTTDRLFVSLGAAQVVLFDRRPGSPTCGLVNEFRLGEKRPALIVIPPKVWHGVRNIGAEPALILNIVDRAYDYASPDHWRVPPDSPDVPFSFERSDHARPARAASPPR
jgi:dTDP-4-dehydrorhamnose 3,5-epimerase